MKKYHKYIWHFCLFILIIFINSTNASEFVKNDLDSLKYEIRTNGFSNSTFDLYLFYLLNSPVKIKKESEFLIDVEQSIYKDIVLAAIEQKKTNYKKSLNLLLKNLILHPKNYFYYDLLLEIATVTDSNIRIVNIIKEMPEDKFVLYFLGRYNFQKANFQKAKTFFYKALKKEPNSIKTLYWLSYTHRKLGNYDKAILLLNSAIKNISKEHREKALLLNALGSLMFLQGDYERAKEVYRLALKSAIQFNYTQESIKAKMNLALIDDIYGDIPEARRKLNNALKDSRKINNLSLEAMVLSELGVSYTYTNELIKAKTNYLNSFEKFLKLSNNSRLSILSYNIGMVYLGMNDFRNAEEYFNKGLKLAGEDVRSKINNLIGLGDLEVNRSNYVRGNNYYEEAKRLSRKINDISTEYEVDMSIGVLYFNLNQNKKSLKLFIELEDKFNKIDFPYLTAELYQKIALNYTSLNNLIEAESYFNKSINLALKNQDILTELNSKTHLNKLKLMINHPDEVIEKLIPILNISLDYGLYQLAGLQTLILSDAFEMINNNTKSKNYLLKSYNYATTAEDFETLIEVNYRLAKYYYKNNQFKMGDKYIVDALKLIDLTSYKQYKKEAIQIPYFSKYKEIYEFQIDHKISQQEYKIAFELYEKYRARNTHQKLVVNKIQKEIINKKEAEHLTEINWKLLSGKEITDSALSSLNNETLNRLYKNNFSTDIDSIKDELNQNEYVISIYINSFQTTVFTISNSIFSTKVLPINESEINNLLSEISPVYDKTLNDKMNFNQDLFAFDPKKAHELYKKLIKPIVKNLPENSSLIFVLPQNLVTFPLELLITELDSTIQKNQFLINKFSISYSPSVSIFNKLNQLSRGLSKNILLVGDPQFGAVEQQSSTRTSDFAQDDLSSEIIVSPLQYSKDEIITIEEKFENSLTLLDIEATETNFKQNLENFSVVHLSTHSYLNENNPVILFSKSDDKNNDGILERGELVSLKMNADLVVLSSCKSGLGIIDKAEGILGMQKSFFDAGCKSTVVSLWNVNDKYTTVLMGLFYNYLGNGFNKSKALRLAKIDFIENYSVNPFYWAGFVISGNTKPLALTQRKNDYSLYLLVVGLTIAIICFYFLAKKRKKSML